MIIKKIRFKNFFSSGNDFIEIDLVLFQRSIISAPNGFGKSTIFSAISFALFGKTIKQVTKPQIVNSINRKDCMVELEFDANGKSYLIRRGIKPNVFDIIENGVLLDQSSVTDYQDFLEEKIIKCSYRTFMQTSIISIENYKPFMSLSAKERRDFFEDILDIKVFSMMNTLIKSKITKNKDEIKLTDISIKNIREKILLMKSHIEELETIRNAGMESIQKKEDAYKKEITKFKKLLNKNNKELEELKNSANHIELQKEKDVIAKTLSAVRGDINKIEKDLSFFELNDSCPTCKQDLIGKEPIKEELRKNHLEKNTQKDEILKSLEIYADLNDQIDVYNEEITRLNSDISVANSTITRLNKMVNDLQNERVRFDQMDDIDTKKADMGVLAKNALTLRDKLAELNTDQEYNLVMLELFKDSGIKAKIIDQYIPVINKLVNEYLEKLDFFVSFNLNSEFVETIKSRHRDDFTYNSFSAGERQKIDLALLFTFRQLAAMKNSFSCNLLLIDELLDSSLDSIGVDLLLGIFASSDFKNTNLYIISHGKADLFEEHFDGVYKVYKRDGFSQISVL